MFAAVPMCGSLIGVVWAVVLTIIGVKHTQETTGGKATVVVLLPWFLCCCIISLLAIIFSAAMFGIVRELMQSGYHNY
jgi:ABC-type polysaccharide transport system permease subunit